MHQATVTSAENVVFTMAENFIRETSRSVFLTGKAGTGKTTFLKHIKENASKKTVVVAPTGVAAIHAGGTTIHSFFQLPFTPFIPEMQRRAGDPGDLSDRYTLLKNLKIESEKRSLFRELELLIIDEVSMVRCDVLDAIDTVLRHFRKKPLAPFGGVQVLFIGDLFQLPPVIPDDQWSILENYYESPFFFHAQVIKQAKPLYLELKKVYRQKDLQFISLLNKIRNNDIEPGDLDILNERYQPGFTPPKETNYITLTTHNHKADRINALELEKLPGPAFNFGGGVEGDFPDRLFPTDKNLVLKKGAQVMFLKNDMERNRRYFNGKIGVIKKIEADKVVVAFPQEGTELEVEKDTWRNVRYTFNATTQQIEEEVIGTFTQYAIRLAWAITIHKSQGLTFDHVIIDAGQSFASGQVYVALSRCRTLEGIVLYSKISPRSISTDERVIAFARQEVVAEELPLLLNAERRQRILFMLTDIFDLAKLSDELNTFSNSLDEKKINNKEAVKLQFQQLKLKVAEHLATASKFQLQIHKLFQQNDFPFLEKRIEAAVAFFTNAINVEIINPLKDHAAGMKPQKRVKKHVRELNALIDFAEGFNKVIIKAPDLVKQLMKSRQ